MAKRRDRDSGRFRIYESERSGFEFGFIPITDYPNAYSRESGKPVSDSGLKVSPTEFDSPPPHAKKDTLGGEGDIGGGQRASSNFDTPSNVFVIPPESTKNIIYVNSSTSIRWNTDPIVYVAGSNVIQTMTVNPQVIAGQQAQIIAVECVGSSVTLLNGSGMTLDIGGSRVLMDSGAVVTMFYNATDSTWHITSFNPTGGL